MVVIEKYQVFETCDKGRGIKALEHISPGEEVIREGPLVFTLTNCKTRGLHCDYCLAAPDNLFKCSNCKYVSYCGKACQVRDWSIHKIECKCLQNISPRQPPDICRLLSLILFKYYVPSKKGRVTDKKDIEGLISNTEHITNARKEAFFSFGAVLNSYLQGCGIDLQQVDVYGLLCRISCNSFTITNSELNSLGTGIYKTSSLLNHSCLPNCIAMFNGTEICIRAISNICPGDELYIAYVNLLDTKYNRQLELKEGYMFQCECSLCNHSSYNDFLMKSIKCDECQPCPCIQPMSPDIVVTNDQKKSYKQYFGGSVNIQSCSSDFSNLNKANDCCDEMDHLYQDIKIVPTPLQLQLLHALINKGEQIVGPTNISLVHAYEVAMDGCLEQEQWTTAYEYSKKLVKPYLVLLPQFHPSVGLHYFKQGKLALHIDYLKDGILYLQKAKEILSITHGSNHELVVTLNSSLKNACDEMRIKQDENIINRIYSDMQ